MDSDHGRAVRFGPFRLYPAQNLLIENEQPLRIGSRALDILKVLTEHAGELVGKQHLIRAVWPSTTVDETNLRVHVAGLRKLLGDGQAGARYIVNEAGRGYRFVAPVSVEIGQSTVPVSAVRISDEAHNLPPQLTRMVGRSDIAASLKKQLSERRFVTIVGPGGIGKTTVALAVAEGLAGTYDDGVKYVDLAPQHDAASAIGAVTAAVGIAARLEMSIPEIVAVLQRKRMLLVLDSCENAIETIAVFAEEILKNAPGSNILATSREPLRAQREWVQRLPPLGIPQRSKLITAAEALKFPAVQLFVERASAVVDEFELNDADAPIVAEICRRLDGIALAVELAAGRVDTFGIRGLAALLDDRFRVLTHGRRTALPRHKTLVAAIDWSYDALPETEQIAFRRLSVFSGPFTLEAALAVVYGIATPESDPINQLANLVSKSLVTADVSGAILQYHLLDTMRAYAAEKLSAADEFDCYARAHATYYKRLFEVAEAERQIRPAAEWLKSYGFHIDNVRAAFDWAFSHEGDASIGFDITCLAAPLWTLLSLNIEFRLRIQTALASLESSSGPDRIRVMQMFAELGGVLVVTGGTGREVNAAWTRVYEIAQMLGDTSYQLRALWGLWIGKLRDKRFSDALTLARTFHDVAANSCDDSDIAIGDRIIGFTLFFLGDLSDARHHTERMLASYVSPSNKLHVLRYQFDQRIVAQSTLATSLWLQGFADRAISLSVSTVDEATDARHPNSLAYALAQSACPIAIFAGHFDMAAMYLEKLFEHSTRFLGSPWGSRAGCIKGILIIKMGDPYEGSRLLKSEIEDPLRRPFNTSYPYHLGELASALGEIRELRRAQEAISEAIRQSEETAEQWCLPELLRIRGEITLRANGNEAAEAAENDFQMSLELACKQEALAWQLRSATSMARLRQLQSRDREALDILGPTHALFREGFDTYDLKSAERLLGELS